METDCRNQYPCSEEGRLNQRFCWNCYNFEDRRDIEGVALCAKGHAPRTNCEDFVEREERLMEIRLNGRFCCNCRNFEDRREIDGTLLCAKGHHPEGNCDEFVDKNKRFREITNNRRCQDIDELFIRVMNEVHEIIKASNFS